jgi:hypothetical protein
MNERQHKALSSRQGNLRTFNQRLLRLSSVIVTGFSLFLFLVHQYFVSIIKFVVVALAT